MLKRKIEDVLLSWKQEENHKPIVIKGCRQCGKTFSVMKFAQENYQHVVYLNFMLNPDYALAFDGSKVVDDMVINISDVKNGDYDKVQDEIKQIKEACDGNLLKVIIETCYLTAEEKMAMCKAVTNANAEYIKTSTGFGTAGAQLEDIRLFKENIGPDVKIKAAGGIRTKEAMEAFLEAGCDRIGASAAGDIMRAENQ